MLGWAAAAFSSACWIAQPVASATWTMRRWLWPPSRVRCQPPLTVAPPSSSRLNGTPRLARWAIAAGRARDDMLDHFAAVEPGAGDHRVADMGFEAVAFLEHRGDPALRPAGRAFAERALGDHPDLQSGREGQRRGQPRRARADDRGRRSGSSRDVPGQREEHVLQVGIAGRDVDDAEAGSAERGEHFAGVDAVLAVGDFERSRADLDDAVEAGRVGRAGRRRGRPRPPPPCPAPWRSALWSAHWRSTCRG